MSAAEKLPVESFLRLPQVRERTGLCTSRIYERMAGGSFPRPFKDGATSKWLESEVTAWVLAEAKRLPRMGGSMGKASQKRKNGLKSAA